MDGEVPNVNTLMSSTYYQQRGKMEIVLCHQNAPNQHNRRDNYQGLIWRKSVNVKVPREHGWYIVDEKLEILLVTCNQAPDKVGEFSYYYCNYLPATFK